MATPSPPEKKTSPFTYVLDYGPRHVSNPEQILTIDDLKKGPRITAMRDLASGMREAGVRWVMPYICAMTINGDHETRTGFWDFFETHPQLYAGLDTYATVGLLVWPEQEWYENKAHSAAVRRITDVLGEAHLLFDFVPESQTTLERLKRYDTVVAPEVRYLSDEQRSVLQAYLKAGGKLLTTGAFASHDERMKERPAESFPELSARLDCREGEDLLKAIGTTSSAALAGGSAEERHVKINAFAADQRIIAHVVNYNVPLGVDAAPLTEMKDFKLEIPLKPGVLSSKALCYTPGEAQAIDLPVHVVDGKAKLTLPSLGIYQVIELTVSK